MDMAKRNKWMKVDQLQEKKVWVLYEKGLEENINLLGKWMENG